jgi:hypothetical protein
MCKQLFLALSLPTVLLFAGCSREPAPIPAEETSPGPTTATSEATVAPSAAALQLAKNADERLECVARQDEAPDPKRVTAGTYCVCNAGPKDADGKHSSVHPTTNMKGEHLHLASPVVIGALADTTSVTLGANPLAFNRLEGGRGLSAMVGYPHVDATTGRGEAMVTHLVNIKRWQPFSAESRAPDGCDKSKNIITISYCYWGSESEPQDWRCAKDVGEGGHLGDIHAQN